MKRRRVTESEPFWLATRLKEASERITDLLSWCEQPDPASITDAWLEEMRRDIADASRRAIEAGIDAKNTAMEAKLRKAQSMSFHLATLMRDLPDLAAKPVAQWRMAAHRQRFDDLAALAREFADASERIFASEKKNAASTDAPPVPAPEATDAPPSPKRERREILESIALGLLLTIGPNAAKIAAQVGVPRTTLMSWDKFKAAYMREKANRQADRKRRQDWLKNADEDDADDDDDGEQRHRRRR